jgi:hypothetical protein
MQMEEPTEQKPVPRQVTQSKTTSKAKKSTPGSVSIADRAVTLRRSNLLWTIVIMCVLFVFLADAIFIGMGVILRVDVAPLLQVFVDTVLLLGGLLTSGSFLHWLSSKH